MESSAIRHPPFKNLMAGLSPGQNPFGWTINIAQLTLAG